MFDTDYEFYVEIDYKEVNPKEPSPVCNLITPDGTEHSHYAPSELLGANKCN